MKAAILNEYAHFVAYTSPASLTGWDLVLYVFSRSFFLDFAALSQLTAMQLVVGYGVWSILALLGWSALKAAQQWRRWRAVVQKKELRRMRQMQRRRIKGLASGDHDEAQRDAFPGASRKLAARRPSFFQGILGALGLRSNAAPVSPSLLDSGFDWGSLPPADAGSMDALGKITREESAGWKMQQQPSIEGFFLHSPFRGASADEPGGNARTSPAASSRRSLPGGGARASSLRTADKGRSLRSEGASELLARRNKETGRKLSGQPSGKQESAASTARTSRTLEQPHGQSLGRNARKTPDPSGSAPKVAGVKDEAMRRTLDDRRAQQQAWQQREQLKEQQRLQQQQQQQRQQAAEQAANAQQAPGQPGASRPQSQGQAPDAQNAPNQQQSYPNQQDNAAGPSGAPEAMDAIARARAALREADRGRGRDRVADIELDERERQNKKRIQERTEADRSWEARVRFEEQERLKAAARTEASRLRAAEADRKAAARAWAEKMQAAREDEQRRLQAAQEQDMLRLQEQQRLLFLQEQERLQQQNEQR